jgi:ABC-type multidrug transport system fused ATPase/permease subunit
MNFVFEKFLEFARLNPGLTATNVMMSLTFPIDDILVPYLSGKIVTLVQGKKPFKSYLIALIAVMVIMQVFYTAIFWHDALFFPKLQNYIRHTMFDDIVKHYQTNPSLSDLRTGEMMSRLVKIPLITVEFFERTKNYIIPYIVSFTVICVYITYSTPVIGITVFLCGLIVSYLITTSPQFCAQRARQQEESLAKLDEETEDILRNLPNVYTSGSVDKELAYMDNVAQKYTDTFKSTTMCSMKVKTMAVLVLSAMLIFFGTYSYINIRNGKLSIGIFVTIFMAITQWYATFGWLTSNIRDIVMEWGVLTSHMQMLNQNNPVVSKTPTTTKTTTTTQSSLPIPNIVPKKGLYVDRVTYIVPGRPTPILNNMSLYVQPNERVAIIGQVGSGKTTLLKIIARLALPSTGDVYVNGLQLSSIPPQEARKLVGYVQQHPILFNRSIYDNVIYGNEAHVDKQAVDILMKRLGLQDAFDNLEHGLDTSVGKNGSVLSGGQRQLVQLMRMMLTDPQIVVMDEVTASLDSNTKNKLFNLLDIALVGKTVIMVTHDEQLMKKATRIVNIDELQSP